MLDAITVEQRGVPAAIVGVEKLVMTTGRAMARAQGYPDFPIAVIRHERGILQGFHDAQAFDSLAEQAAPQLVNILLGRTGRSA